VLNKIQPIPVEIFKYDLDSPRYLSNFMVESSLLFHNKITIVEDVPDRIGNEVMSKGSKLSASVKLDSHTKTPRMVSDLYP